MEIAVTDSTTRPVAVSETLNPEGKRQILSTKRLPGERWIDILKGCDCRIDVLGDNDGQPLTAEQLHTVIDRDAYVGAIGQLNEPWNAATLEHAARRGLRAFSTFAVGYDNVDLEAATRLGILVGNTPGVLTEATAELAVALTFAAARRVAEMDRYTRDGRWVGWHATLGMGRLLEGATVGVVGAGRIGSCYAEKMVGVGCSILYVKESGIAAELESYVKELGALRKKTGRKPVSCRRAESLEACLRRSDVVSLHVPLTPKTRGMVGEREFGWMKPGAILINTARGPVVDELALVKVLSERRIFAAGFDVYEKEPALTPSLVGLPNTVLLPHIGSATNVTREGMAVLAACNIRGILEGYPPVDDLAENLKEFLSSDPPPKACPSLLNRLDSDKRI